MEEAFFLVMDVGVRVGMGMVVSMVVVVIVVLRSVGVTVSTEDKETDEVEEQTGATDREDQDRVADLWGLDETREGFENDGYA